MKAEEEAVCVCRGEGARACMKGSRMSRHESAALTTDGVSEISIPKDGAKIRSQAIWLALRREVRHDPLSRPRARTLWSLPSPAARPPHVRRRPCG